MSSLSYDDALALVRRHVVKENNIKHMIAVGAIMRALAHHWHEDEMRWEMLGILHDIDYEVCSGPCDHAIKAGEMLKGTADEEIVRAILSHNHENTGVLPESRMEKALLAADAASGLVVAATLVLPTKKVMDLKRESLLKKFHSKDFAKGVSRERIMRCSEIGLGLEQFLDLSLEGMRNRAESIGL